MSDVEDLLVFGAYVSFLADLVVIGNPFLMAHKSRTFALRFPELTIVHTNTNYVHVFMQ